MNINKIRSRLRAEPFQPFRLIITDGGAFDVPHPEFCAIGDRIVFVAIPPSKRDPESPASGKTLSPMHISRIETIAEDEQATA